MNFLPKNKIAARKFGSFKKHRYLCNGMDKEILDNIKKLLAQSLVPSDRKLLTNGRNLPFAKFTSKSDH